MYVYGEEKGLYIYTSDRSGWEKKDLCFHFQNWIRNSCVVPKCIGVQIFSPHSSSKNLLTWVRFSELEQQEMGSSKIVSVLFMETHPLLLFTIVLFLICLVSPNWNDWRKLRSRNHNLARREISKIGKVFFVLFYVSAQNLECGKNCINFSSFTGFSFFLPPRFGFIGFNQKLHFKH